MEDSTHISNARSMPVDAEVDARGLNCPMPILKAKKALQTLASGQTVRVFATDRSAPRDFQAFARQTGNAIVALDEGPMECVLVLARR